MKTNYLIILFCSILISVGCAHRNHGLYGKCPVGYLGCLQIQINADSTFNYYSFMDVGPTITRIDGSWQRSGDTLFLTSPTPEINEEIFCFENTDTSKTIKLAYRNKLNSDMVPTARIYSGVTIIEVTLNYLETITLALASQPIDSIQLYDSVSNEKFHTYLPQDSLANQFLFTTLTLTPEHFSNQAILVKNKKLHLWTDSTGSFDREIYLKKTDLKNRVF